MIVARGVGLEYQANGRTFAAVAGVDLDLPAHSFTAIVGPSGSGKSSLLYLLSGLRAPTAGSISFDGRDYSGLGTAGVTALRRSRFGFIFQQHFLVNYLGALENAMVGQVGPGSDAATRAAELLGRLGLGDKLQHRPYQLSVGERQRVAVARAMVAEPDMIFADEPTASLDQRTGLEVIAMLGAYRDRGAVLVVTHDMAMTAGCDAVLTMRDGRIYTPPLS